MENHDTLNGSMIASTTKRSKDDILLFLVKNSKPEYGAKYFDASNYIIEDKPKRTRKQKLMDLFLVLSSANRYICEFKSFEDFLGEHFHFEKHLRPLFEDGVLHFSDVATDGLYNTPQYREIFAKTRGLIRDYRTGVTYVAFYYRENSFIENYNKIIDLALKLNLFK